MNASEVAARQRIDLEILQRMPGQQERVIRTNAWRGVDANGEDIHTPWEHESLYKGQVLSLRSILLTEIVFDLDIKDWKEMKATGDKLDAYLRRMGADPVKAHSGGKGVHLHVFINPPMFDDETEAAIKKFNIDRFNVTRQAIFNKILAEAHIEQPGIDLLKVGWSARAKGSMIRTFGCPRADGGYKTLITEIPETRPAPGSLPLVFPDAYKMWAAPPIFVAAAAAAMKAEIANHQKEAPTITCACSADGVPCHALVLKAGVRGKRNENAYNLAMLEKTCGTPLEMAKSAMVQYAANCEDTNEEIGKKALKTLDGVYAADYTFSCWRLKQGIAPAVVNCAGCPILLGGSAASIDNPEYRLDEYYTEARKKKDGTPIERKVIPHAVAGRFMKLAHFVTMDEGEGKFTTLIYEGGVYVEGGANKIYRACELALGCDCNNFIVNEVLGHIRRRTLIRKESAESHPDRMSPWICLENGVINVHTREFKPHDPRMIFLSKCPVNFDINAKCPVFSEFLISVLSGNMPEVEKMKQWIGYLLDPGYIYHKGVLLVGEGGNGKTTLISTIEAFLGDGNYSGVSFQGLDPTVNRFAGYSLYGKLANIHDDIGAQEVKDDSVFKMACGGGTLQVERKFKDPINYHSRAKLMFSCNNVPPAGDDSSTAYYRRWMLFMFNQIYEGDRKDPLMLQKLTSPSELSGILNLALDGLAALRKQGCFTNEGSVAEIRKQYDELSDPVSVFVEEMVDESPAHTNEKGVWISAAITTKEDIYSAYLKWAEGNDKRAKLSEKRFAQLLVKRLKLKPTDEKRVKINPAGERKNAWVGIQCDTCENYGGKGQMPLDDGQPSAPSDESDHSDDSAQPQGELERAMKILDPAIVDPYERLLLLITAKSRRYADYVKADPANEGRIRKLKEQGRITEDADSSYLYIR